ncbi:MAG: 3-dehydroquinate synthase [Kiritimatiellae bacterium]|nr:3-dehydroquinate synthase [Kiritimatiellia bacterium]
MPQQITVDLGERSYRIHIASGLLNQLGNLCIEQSFGQRCMIVSDSNVDTHYGDSCEYYLKKAGFLPCRVVVPAGEKSKSLQELSTIYDIAIDHQLDRSSFIVALGGGVVGDLAGYAAASFLRGIPCVQMPTSLLAMVDSAVGGKTGVNLPQGKNLIGAFHQPTFVLADLNTLKTLPKREYMSGMAEIIKYGVIRDLSLFQTLENQTAELLQVVPEVLEPIIARSCQIKAEVVQLDEREGGLRSILNFGHTVGHAIEQASGYKRYLHGEAIALGMVFAAKLSVHQKEFPSIACDHLVALLESFNLPIKVSDLAWADLRKAIGADKKTVNATPYFVLAEEMGKVAYGCEVAEDVLEQAWSS